MSTTKLQQQDFENESQKLLNYAQLCNAFYERELRLLAECDFSPKALRRRLSSLPFYIKRAAESLLCLDNPLQLDSQNGTWSTNQKRKSPSFKITLEQNRLWFEKNIAIGLIIAVEVIEQGVSSLRLDCIDEIDTDLARFHVNEQGWFDYFGCQVDGDELNKRAIKSSKDVICAACCGHQWIGIDKTYQRTLSLRELLLSTVINWTKLNKPLY